MPDTAELKGKTDDTSVIELAMTRWKQAQEAEYETREKCLDDLKFSTGDQWPANIKAEREKDNLPCLTMDQTQQSVRIVTNEYRAKRPSGNITPVGDGADVDSAEIIQGMVRHIEVRSDSEIAYDNAHEAVTRIGFGSWRFLPEYIDDDSDDQEVLIAPIRNQFSVYWQPGVPTKKAKWAFIIEDIPRENYEEDYPDSKYSQSSDSLTEFMGRGNASPEWVMKDVVRVAEYFEIIEKEVKGKKRKKKQVIWRKINATEVLEGPTDLPGTSIPIFTAVGDDFDVDGKRHLAGLIRNAKDPQRMYNFWTSAATEKIALSKTAPYIAVVGAIANPAQWENPKNTRVLYYNQVDVAGKPAPRPERDLLEPQIDSMRYMTQQAAMDVKASMGVYDPSLGQHKGDESGKAIQHLQEQGSLATSNYSDNVAREMRRSYYELIEWMRFYYDTPRIQRIIMPDGTNKQIVIHNGPEQADQAQQMLTQQITKAFDISVGRYDVTVSIGPSYQTKRQEAVATEMDLLKVLGPAAQNILDLVVGEMDIPQAKEIAKRLKMMLPPQLQGDDDTDPQVKLNKMQSTLQQMSQQHELLTKALQDAQKVVETKQIEQQGKMQIAQMQEQTKAAIVKMQEATKLAVAQINASKDLHETIADNEIKQYDLLHSAAHDIALQKDQQAHEQMMGAQQTAADQQSQESDQSHEADMTAANQQHEQTMAEQQQEGGNES
jgi:Phage P22-like portal protein